MTSIYIYMMTDPDYDTAYVGKSENPTRRAREHMCDGPSKLMRRWRDSLKSRQLSPVLTVLAECDEPDARQAELDAIAMVRAVRGSALLNKLTVLEL